MIRTMGIKQNKELANQLGEVGQVANGIARENVFQDYQERKSPHTIDRQKADLALFAEFLKSSGVDTNTERLSMDPQSWKGITWGLVASFVGWQLAQGYAIGSINVRLSTVRVYAKLALKAGAIDTSEYALIQAVEGYSHKEIRNVDRERDAANLPTRVGPKKATAVNIKKSQAAQLKNQPNTPQGRRDALLMCILLDHGLRLGETLCLDVENFDLEEGLVRFYRSKVDKIQVHRLSPDTLAAAKAYFEQDAPKKGNIWRASASKQDGVEKFRTGQLIDKGMSARALTQRVKVLGKAVGLEKLSPHDCRHFWATLAIRNKTPIDRVKNAGGWTSVAMVLRYVEDEAIANEGVIL